MKRIRAQLALLTLVVASTGILGTAFFMTRAYIGDKKNYVVEVSAAAAPTVSDSIVKRLQELISKTALFEAGMDEAASRKEKKAPFAFLTRLFDEIPGISGIRIYHEGKLVHDIELGTSVKSEQEIIIPNLDTLNTPSFLRGSDPSETLFLAPHEDPSRKKSLYVFRMQNSFFQSSYDLAPALHPLLIDHEGVPFTQSSIPGLDGARIKALLKNSKQGAVIAQEAENTEGKRELFSLAKISSAENAFVLLRVPMMTPLDLIRPVLLSNFQFLIGVFLLSVLLSAYFARKVARPIEALTEASMQIAKGEWKVPELKHGSLEISRLVRAFTKMVTDLEIRENEVRRANQELVRSERLAALGRFGAGIAHEVKNPLASILGYSQLIRRKLPAPLEQKEIQYVDFIMDETKRASNIISDLLIFARQKPPELKEQSIRPLLERTLEMARPESELKGVTLDLEISREADDTPVAHDPNQLFQVLSNLVLNAFQALEEKMSGQRDFDKRVLLRADLAPQSLVIEVVDNGPGISEENLKRLFEPFFSTKEVGKGSGLGLALSLGIVEQHQGKIEVVSKVGEGTTFRITLPLKLPRIG